jgi:hypothetical protein
MSHLAISDQQTILNPYFAKSPGIAARDLERGALKWKTLTLISAVAMAAMMGIILAASCGAMTLPLTLFIPLLGATVLSDFSLGKCLSKYRQLSESAQLARGVADQWNQIKDWDEKKILSALSEDYHILSEKNRSYALDLLPGLAYYIYQTNLAASTLASSREHLTKALENKEVQFENQRTAWRQIEFVALPAIIKASTMLQILSDPTSQIALGSHTLVCKSFEQRHLDYLCSEPNDDYLKDPSKEIPFKTIYSDPDPLHVRELLYN